MDTDEIKPGEQLTLAQINRLVKQAQEHQAPTQGSGLREDGPTVDEFIASGYKASNYPPAGYASRSTDEEIEAALKAEKDAPETDPLKMKVPELKEWLTEKGIAFDPSAKKEDLQALVPAE
jgi:hypothetical protein